MNKVIKKAMLLLAWGVVVTVATTATATATAPAPRSPNILLILADDMGFNDIQPFGQTTIQTPSLNALAGEGMRFTNFHVHATCSPTRAQMLTGVDNHLAGMGAMGEFRTPEMEKYPGSYIGSLNDRVKTVAEVLKEKGYATFMTGKWHLGAKPEQTPAARGFDRSFALVNGGGSHWDDRGLLAIAPKSTFLEDGRPVPRSVGEFSSDLYTDKFLAYLRAAHASDKPFFGYLAFQAPHDPVQAPKAYIEKYKGKFADGYDEHRLKLFANMKRLGLIPAATKMGEAAPLFKPWGQLSPTERREQERLMEIYAGMVDNLDHNIGRVVKELKRAGLYENTIIFFLSDNGPSAAYMGLYPGNADGRYIRSFDTSYDNLGAPDSFAAVGPGWAYASSAPFRLFKMLVTEGGTISPMIVRAPGISRPGSINDGFIGVEDIFPTVLAATGAERGTERHGVPLEPLKGGSFLPVLRGAAATAHPVDYERGEELFGNKAYRQGDWKISWLPKPYGTEQWQLFDTRNDRGETRDVAAQHPELVAAMAKRYDKWAQQNRVMQWDYRYLSRELFDYFDWRKGSPKQLVNQE